MNEPHTFVFRGKLGNNPDLPATATHFLTDAGRRQPIRKPRIAGLTFGFVNTDDGWVVTQVDALPLRTPVPITPAHYAGHKGIGPNGCGVSEASARTLFTDIVRLNASMRRELRSLEEKLRDSLTVSGHGHSASTDSRETQRATDVAVPPKRYKAEVSRIVRDTAMVRRLKALHRDRCQLCGHTVRLGDGSTYSEGHHLRPLGGDHRGPDVSGNVLILCPNCHAICDLAGTRLVRSRLLADPDHDIDQMYVDFHNGLADQRASAG